MSSVQHLREFISERLTAAAAEIFAEFEQTIVQYEEELERQRKLLEVTYMRIGLPPQQKEVSADQQVWNQDRKSGLDQEEVFIGQEGEHLVLKQEAEDVTPASSSQESPVEPNGDPSHYLPSAEDEEGTQHILTTMKMKMEQSHSDDEDTCLISEITSDSDTREECVKWDGATEQRGGFHTGEASGGKGSSPTAPRRIQQEEKPRSSGASGNPRRHAGEGPFPCRICGEHLATYQDLLAHVGPHTGVRPFLCGICGKRFNQGGHVSEHMRSHTDERPFACAMCGKRFLRVFHLKRHLRSHTGEKPYSCGTCGKGFTRRDLLSVHMSVHVRKAP